jgi:hypothetical protein
MAVAANGNDRLRPVHPDAPHQTAEMRTHFLAVRRLAWAQDGDDAVPGGRVIDMDRQKAVLVVMRVEQRQLLMTVHGIGGVVDIEGDRLRRA